MRAPATDSTAAAPAARRAQSVQREDQPDRILLSVAVAGRADRRRCRSPCPSGRAARGAADVGGAVLRARVQTIFPNRSIALADGQISSDLRKSCQALKSKIFRFTFLQIGIRSLAVSAHKRGVRDRHETLGRGCDGRFGVRRALERRTKAPKRTAKSCGPGAAMLAPSLAGAFPRVTATTSALTGESTKYAVKPLRRGCRSVSAHLYARVRQMRNSWHTRPRVSAHPVFPAPSVSERDNEFAKARAKSCREITDALTSCVVIVRVAQAGARGFERRQ